MRFSSSTLKLTLFLISFFLAFYPAHPYLFLGYEIRDLEKNNEDSFIEDASAWTISQFDDPQRPIKYNRCGGTFMLGGPGVLGSYFFSNTKYGQSGKYYERVYKDLPKHNSFGISFRFWAIGDWDYQDSIDLQVDGRTVYSWYLNEHAHSHSDACPENDNDSQEYRISFATDHNADSLWLKFVSQLNKPSKDGSFGFRDINLIFTEMANKQIYSGIYRGYSPIPLHNSIGAVWQAVCPINKYEVYYTRSTYCAACNSSCSFCFDRDHCYRCQSGYYFDGKTCQNSCPENCEACSGPDSCKECQLGYILVESKCLLPCALINDYRHENGSCLNECSSSLVPRAIGAAKFCFEDNRESRVELGLIIGASVGGAISLLSAIGVYFYIRRRKLQKVKKTQENLVQNDQIQKAQEQNENGTDILLTGIAGEIIERPLEIKDEMFVMKMPAGLEGDDNESRQLERAKENMRTMESSIV